MTRPLGWPLRTRAPLGLGAGGPLFRRHTTSVRWVTQPVSFSPDGPSETVLPAEADDIRSGIEGADATGLAAIVAEHPTSLIGWAALGEQLESNASSIRDVVNAYAAFRVGYHRGLDSLRKNGWRGSGYVHWRHETNRGFLRCLAGLGRMAERIGESDEHQRVSEFLRQLDPSWPPDDLL